MTLLPDFHIYCGTLFAAVAMVLVSQGRYVTSITLSLLAFVFFVYRIRQDGNLPKPTPEAVSLYD